MEPAPKLPRHRRTRIAPSPTGPLHLGHVANALWTVAAAADAGAEVIVRMEDHDRGRSRTEHEAAILDDLRWLGLPLDPVSLDSLAGRSDYRQSDVPDRYAAAADQLAERGLVYGCACSRREIAAAAPVDPGDEPTYPGTCRARALPLDSSVGLRVRLSDDAVTFPDVRHGPQTQVPARQCGDLLIRDRHGNWTYQFCVVVDDLVHDVDLVVRGDDILSSTGRQILLGRLLGREKPPTWLHHPLILGPDGAKLSKRDGATGIGSLRAAGASPAAILGMAASATGLIRAPEPIDPSDLGRLFASWRRAFPAS